MQGLREPALSLVSEARARLGSIDAVARMIGYSRASLSLALNGRYPGSTDRMEAAALDRLGQVNCPHLGRQIGGPECRQYRTRPMPMSSVTALRHWQACRTCRHNPEREGEGDV